jgi:hypothetical protein
MRTSESHFANPRRKNEFGRAGLSERFSTNREARPHRSLVLLIWLYFWLLIWEGALRKWIFPSLSAPLLIVRDPVVILIYAIALAQGVFPLNRFVLATIGLAVVPLARPSRDHSVRAANKLSSFATDISDAEGFGPGRCEPIWALVFVVGSANDIPCALAICVTPGRLD